MQDRNNPVQFERLIVPHLDAAFNLARWLTRNEQDAEDIVQEACLRAYRSFGGFRGGDPRAWLLAIVRNSCYTWLRQNRMGELASPLDSDLTDIGAGPAADPEAILMARVDSESVRQAIEELPVEFREVIVLRELEDLSYREIADVAAIPLGTVMSRLARARKRLEIILSRRFGTEVRSGL